MIKIPKTLVIPRGGYKPILNVMNTEIAVNELKKHFEARLSENLNLIKVSPPLLVSEGNGINDNLSGSERVVSFDALDIKDHQIEIVQSLAKWKRVALSRYGFTTGEGLYTNMNAVRRDEVLDNLHSMYVDQWDWEKIISKDQRNLKTLKAEVRNIYQAMKSTEKHMYEYHPALKPVLPEDIYFITAQELEDLYSHLNPKEREDSISKEYGAVFLMQIGGALRSGTKHDSRSPDYDDWSFNGDILFWSPLLERSIEISSMGIRVDENTLLKQLKLENNEERILLEYHKSLLNGELPYTLGGGIGQSRLCMFLLKKAHIGEVQASVWNVEILRYCQENNINLL